MKFVKKRTARGFDYLEFTDDYDAKCSVQISSAVEPHIWLGVDDADPKIMASDAVRLGLPVPEGVDTTCPAGWIPYNIPKGVLLTTRMHLTRKQAKKLGKKLLHYARFGKL